MKPTRTRLWTGMLSLLVVLVILLPLVLLLIWSFTARWPWPELLPSHWSLRGWQQLHSEWRELSAVLRENLLISLGVSSLAVIIALMSGKVFLRLPARAQKCLRFFIILPLLIPATVFGMGIHPLFIRWHLANTIVGVMIVHLIYSLPYVQLLVLNAYKGPILELEEQAALLGANAWQVLRLVTFPLLLPVLVVGFMMSYIVSFSQYFLTQLIGGGRVSTLATNIFPYLQANDRTIASVYSLIFLALTLVVFWFVQAGVNRYQQRHLI